MKQNPLTKNNHPIIQSTTKSVLNAKPKRKRRTSSSSILTEEEDGDDDEEEDLPANLKRKISAKRPFLGHVVPKDSPTRTYRKSSGGSNQPQLRAQGQKRDIHLNNPSNLKILGGSRRGRKLQSPNVYLRPMMGKVREAVFSTLTSFGLFDEGVVVVGGGIRHLDVYAGSGSVGLESLSRGANHCTFVDFSRDCCDAVEFNVRSCHFGDDDDDEQGVMEDNDDDDYYTRETQTLRTIGRTRILCSDAMQTLKDPQSAGLPNDPYHVVTICPPYEEVVYADLLDSVANSPLVMDDTVVVVEYPIELGCLPHVYEREDGGAMIGVRNRKYGRTVIAIYVVNPTGKMEVAESRPEEFISF